MGVILVECAQHGISWMRVAIRDKGRRARGRLTYTVGEEQEVESESEQWSAINERWKRAVSAFKPEDDSRQDTPD